MYSKMGENLSQCISMTTYILSLAFKITSYTKLQYFQCNFLHRIPYSIIKLFKLKYTIMPMCTFSHTVEETILNFFCEGKVTKLSWNEICNMLTQELKINIQLVDSFDIRFEYKKNNNKIS